MTARLVADDLFAGAGGWDVACNWLDVHGRGVELMPEARATRDAAGLTTIHDDVWTFTPDSRAQGLIASPPCQTFSQAGSGSGRKALDAVLSVLPHVADMTLPELRQAGKPFGDDRTALVLTPLWFALQQPYRWLAWEQVPTVLPVWKACAEVLRVHGWHVWTGSLNAEQYGVPQTRRRAFLLASRDGQVTAPTPTHSQFYPRTPSKLDPGVRKWVSMAEALGWGMLLRPSPTVTGGGTETGGAEPIGHLSRYTGRPDWLDRPGYDPLVETPDGAERWRIVGQVPDKSWPFNRPSTTVASRDLVQNPGETANRHNSSTKTRNDGVRVSVEEAAVLQSFPADFPWQGGDKDAKGRKYLQVGNAVPPLLAMAALTAAMGEPYMPPILTGEPADLPHTHMAGAGRTAHETAGQQPRRVDEPAHTITGSGTAYWLDHTDERRAPAQAETLF